MLDVTFNGWFFFITYIVMFILSKPFPRTALTVLYGCGTMWFLLILYWLINGGTIVATWRLFSPIIWFN